MSRRVSLPVGLPIPWALSFLAGAYLPLAQTYDARRLCLVVLLSLLVLIAIPRRRLLSLPPHVLLAALFVISLGIISSIVSAAPGWGLLGVAYTMLCLLSMIVLGRTLGQATRVDFPRLVALGFVLPVGLSCFAMGATVYSSLLSGVTLTYPEPLRDFFNIRFFNQYQTWTLPFLVAALSLGCPLTRVRASVWKALVIFIAVFFFAMYWHSSGRATGYATLIASLIVAFCLGPAGRMHAGRMAALALAGYVVNLVMFGAGVDANARMLSFASPGRWHLLAIAWTQIEQHPWLGIGPMLYASLDTHMASHPHDAIVLWAVEWGVPAALIATGTIAALLIRSLCRARQRLAYPNDVPAPLLVAVVASLLAGAAHALVSGIVVMPASQFELVLVSALAIGLFSRTDRGRPHGDTRLFIRPLPAIVYAAAGLAVVYVDLFTFHDYATRVQMPPPKTAVYMRNANQPRYWADGTLTSVVFSERARKLR